MDVGSTFMLLRVMLKNKSRGGGTWPPLYTLEAGFHFQDRSARRRRGASLKNKDWMRGADVDVALLIIDPREVHSGAESRLIR